MTERNPERGLEEAIVPVSRQASGAEPPRLPRRRRGGKGLAAAALGAVLVTLAATVFLGLPRWVEQRAETRAAAAPPVPETPPESTEPALSEEELAALRAQSETLLATLLQQQQRLDERSAMSWGGATWERYEEQSKLGDQTYLEKDYAQAATHYENALELGEELLARSGEIIEAALAAGSDAIAAGNSVLAIQQFSIVLGVDPENDAARAGRSRAERLPEVLELVRRGDESRQARDLAAARDLYRQALSVDPAWSPAQTALAEVAAALSTSRFDELVSSGFAALAEESYQEAGEHFSAALGIRPSSEIAREGLTQAEQGQRLDQIALAEVRALAFERREMWNEAIKQYENALATDATLAFALAGLERSQARADLDQKLENLIENPNLLLTDTVFEDAQRLLEDARQLPDLQTRLADQVERLGQLVELAATPITVELRSDERTEVTVYRVGKLGVFVDKEIQVRPGTYTVVGSRDGYRDVRRTITVLPGRTVDPVSVVCEEPI